MDRYNFIWKTIQVHGYKYDYRKVEYKGSKTKVCIICKEHGEFYQKPNDHLNGQGCPICANNVKLTTESFTKKAEIAHKNLYDYSKVDYVDSQTKICIICKKHGEFWQVPAKHLYGQSCPTCSNENNISELIFKEKIQNVLDNVIYQKRFDWLGRQSLDFYLPDYNVAIEYQGRQHFKDIYNDAKEFYKTCRRDENKYHKCLENNIKLLYFTYDKRDIPIKYHSIIFTDENNLINYIKDNYDRY